MKFPPHSSCVLYTRKSDFSRLLNLHVHLVNFVCQCKTHNSYLGLVLSSLKFLLVTHNSPFIHSYSALEAGLAGTRAQSCDRYGSGTLHPGQVLGLVCHCFPPPLDVPTFAARCLYVRNDARDPSSERWNCGREIVR